MVDAGETTDAAMRREFAEEALAGQSVAEATRVMGGEGREVFRGCVADDPRNTDNAWMETVVKVFVVREEEAAGVALRAGDDAVGVQWCDVSDRLEMYANHKQFIEMTARLLGAYF
jgi:8-oxo-dGTP pyrophosphatase MutT (NUDIX family)